MKHGFRAGIPVRVASALEQPGLGPAPPRGQQWGPGPVARRPRPGPRWTVWAARPPARLVGIVQPSLSAFTSSLPGACTFLPPFFACLARFPGLACPGPAAAANLRRNIPSWADAQANLPPGQGGPRKRMWLPREATKRVQAASAFRGNRKAFSFLGPGRPAAAGKRPGGI